MDCGAATLVICVPPGCASARVFLAEGLCKRRGWLRTLGRQGTDLRTQFQERVLHGERIFPNDGLQERAGEPMQRKRFDGAVLGVWMMGGGPRTYPGGLRKWQWKRRQRKDLWELEKQRLSRERKLFETRRRHELKRASPSGAFTLERPAESFDLAEVMMATGRSREGLLSPGGLHGEAEARDIMDWDADLEMTTVEGKRDSKSRQKAWIGSKRDVVEQIQKVQNRVMEKYTRARGASDHANASWFPQPPVLPVSRLTLKALSLIVGTQNIAQQDVIRLLLKGEDLLARTNTSIEDSISSLIYAVELVLRERQQLPRSEIARLQEKLTVSGRSPITALLVCPTQDRASFLATDAKQLVMFHPNIEVQIVKGGTDVKEETQRLRKLPCEIVVATPGRLLSHLQRSPEFRGQLNGLKLLALHDVQKLLDMGYRKTLECILQLLPRSRQTLLWSSTISDEILAFSQSVFRKQYEVFNRGRADEDEVAYRTAKQEFITMPIESHLAVVCSLLKSHVAQEPNFKVVVFCQTVRTTTFMGELFRSMGFYSLEVHMRKSERQRERVAAEFRTTRGGVILFTCGSSVWGVANPDVSLVLQIGPPSGREQYIQRVTLSGQETSKREFILLLMVHQLDFLQELGTIPLSEAKLPEVISDTVAQVRQGVHQVNYLVRVKAYLAWLRYHIARTSSDNDREKVLHLSGMYSTALGFQVPPQLNLKTRRALGLAENPPHNGSPLTVSK